MNNPAEFRYFRMEEFKCPCCDENKINLEFALLLNEARDYAGIPFVINSAYRCEKHNKAVGGKAESSHTLGLAVDLKAASSRERYLILSALFKVGFKRIGIGSTFIHVDADMSKDQEVVWLY